MVRLLPWIFTAAGAAAIVVPHPEFFSQPRFWAEEGSLYFAAAWAMPWWQALTIHPNGYFCLYNNVAAVLATQVPLVHAPLVTTLAAFAVQLVGIAIIAGGRAPEWRHPCWRAIGIAIVLFGPSTGEIWLNTTNSQVYFALIAALLLLEPANAAPLRAGVDVALLALAGLSGVAPCAFAPLFAVRAAMTRTGAAIASAVAIGSATVVQVFMVMRAGDALSVSVRQMNNEVAVTGMIVWMRTLIRPVAGTQLAESFAMTVGRIWGFGLAGPGVEWLGVGLLVAAGAVLAWLCVGAGWQRRVAMVASYVVLLALVLAGGVGNRRMYLNSADASSRYFYVPGVLVLFLLRQNVRLPPSGRPSVRAVVCACLLAASIVGGLLRYPSTVLSSPHWPNWASQVNAWQAQPGRAALAIWPPGWSVQLTPRSAGGAGPLAHFMNGRSRTCGSARHDERLAMGAVALRRHAPSRLVGGGRTE
jgi:hypothetical protein